MRLRAPAALLPLLAALPLLSAARAAAQAPIARTPLAFEEALTQSLASPRATRAALEVAAADAQRKAILSTILPKVTATGSLVLNSAEVKFGSGAEARTILAREDWSTRVTVSQPVFAGFREKRAYDQSRLAVDSAREALRGTEDGIVLAAAADYLAVVQGDLLVDIEARSRELAENRRKQANDLFDAGETTRADVLRAVAAVKGAERRLVAARRSRDDAEGRLRELLGFEGGVEVREPERPLPDLPSLEELVTRALDRRPEVRGATLTLRTARLEVLKQKGAYFPVVTADAGYVHQKVPFPKDSYGYGALRFTVPIFQSGELGARVSIARQRERQAELSLEETRRAVREDVSSALRGVEAAKTSLALATEQLAAAEAEYAQLFDLYRSQEATAVDLEAAESVLAEARRAVVDNRLQEKLAEMQVWYATGSLRETAVKDKETTK